MKRITAFVLTLAIAECVLGVSASAQNYTSDCDLYAYVESHNSPACRVEWGWQALGAHIPPSGSIVCNNGVPFGSVAVTLRPSCGPPPNTAHDICLSCLTAGAPINLSSGNTYIIESDASIPGLGGGLRLSRTWNSMLPPMQNSYPFMFGINWRSTYEERLIPNGGDGYVKYLRADGSVWSFAADTFGSPNVYKAAVPANDTTTTLTDGSPSWTMTSKSGEKRIFDAISGVLTAIVDRNGNTTQLSYDGSHRLTTVTDPASRHLTFTYTSPSSNLVSSDIGCWHHAFLRV